MRLSARLASTSVILITGLSSLASRAAAQSPPAPSPTIAATDSTTPPTTKSHPTGAKPSGPPPRAINTSDSGISSNPKNNTTANYSLISPSLPISGPPRTGLFPSVGAALLDDGIDIHGIALDHFLANPSGGNIPHQTYNLSALAPAVDFNLDRLIGLQGGNVHLVTTLFGLRSNIPGIARDTGGFIDGYQTTPVPSTTPFLLSVLTYEQKLLNDRLSIEFGRTNAYRYFLLPNSLDPFEAYGTTFNVVGDFNSIPYPSWGAHATYHFEPKWYVQAGGFANNYYRAIFNNLNLGAEATSGAQILGEVGYRSEFNNAAYPANFEIGSEWNTSGHAFNIKGAGVVATNLDVATSYPGGGVFFFEGQQILWRGRQTPAGPPPNIALYGSAGIAYDKPQPFDGDGIVGINFTGLIPGRPYDALGLQAHYQRLSAVEADFETRNQIRFAGPGPAQNRNNWGFEAVYNIQVTPWLKLDPVVQYYVNPDDFVGSTLPRRPTDGFVVGGFLNVALGKLLGTSNKAF